MDPEGTAYHSENCFSVSKKSWIKSFQLLQTVVETIFIIDCCETWMEEPLLSGCCLFEKQDEYTNFSCIDFEGIISRHADSSQYML
jgi:hypothetical protein